MEQSFKITLWILLVGCLQARPATEAACKLKMKDLGFELLKDIQCPKDMNFISPKKVEKCCLREALRCLKIELDRASEKCDDDGGFISMTSSAIENSCFFTKGNCTLTTEVHQEFTSIVNEAESIVQQLNSNPMFPDTQKQHCSC